MESLEYHGWAHKKCSYISGKLKDNIDFHCKRCLEGSSDQSVLLREVEIEPNLKLECVSRFCYLDDMLVARTRVGRRQQELK